MAHWFCGEELTGHARVFMQQRSGIQSQDSQEATVHGTVIRMS